MPPTTRTPAKDAKTPRVAPQGAGQGTVDKHQQGHYSAVPLERNRPSGNGTGGLGDFLRHEVYPRLTPEMIYTNPAHKWQKSQHKWRGACPWHNSKTGSSFNVSPDSGLWYCAGCGFGGGPLEYLWRHQGGQGSPRGKDFVSLVRELAELADVPFPERDLAPEEIKAAQQRASRGAALSLVYVKCQEWLESAAGEQARDYLHGRGLTDDSIRDLGLGLYKSAGEIRAALAKASYPAGVNEGVDHNLEGYITFPWHDDNGHPLTVYGRWPAKEAPAPKPKTYALPGEGSKGSPLYFDRARRAGSDVVLVEGLLDAALLQAAGETSVCAYVGATPSVAQLEALQRWGIKAATICPDPDAAGDSGILSFLQRLAPGIRAYVAPRLPDGLDPDELVLRDGAQAWREHIGRAAPGSIYRTQHILSKHDLATPKGRDDALEDLGEYVATLPPGSDLEALSEVAAQALKTKPKPLAMRLGKAAKAITTRNKSHSPTTALTATPAHASRPEPLEPITLTQLLREYARVLRLDDPGSVEIKLATVVANRAEGDPVWLLTVAPPGGGKTEELMPLSVLPDVHLAATLTEASLLSGTASKERADNATGGILRQVGERGIILIKDFSGILSINRDTRGPVLAALREVYDGHWSRPVGTDGGRVLEWHGKCGVVGAATPAIDGYHATMSMLGERFAFYRGSEKKRVERTKKALLNTGNEAQMRARLAHATKAFFAGLPDSPPPAPLTEAESDWLVNLADLAVKCRSAVERDAYSPAREIINVPGAEFPTRFVKVLAQLRRGLLTIGVKPRRAWKLTQKVAFDSMPRLRYIVLDYLHGIKEHETRTTRAVGLGTGMPGKSVERALEELLCYGIVERQEEKDTNQWRLSEWARATYTAVKKLPGDPDGSPETREGEYRQTSLLGSADSTGNTQGGESNTQVHYPTRISGEPQREDLTEEEEAYVALAEDEGEAVPF